jgi:hypothetical protein
MATRRIHRLVTPTYPLVGNGATAPFPPDPGTTYDWINDPNNNGDSGVPANADANKMAFGPNEGSWLFTYQEDLTSEALNRGPRALAENSDYFDDLFHRAVGRVTTTALATAGIGGVALITLSNVQPFVGSSPGVPLTDLFKIVDGDHNEIVVNATGNICRVTAIAGAAVGDGFVPYATPLNLTITPPIPEAQSYRVVYVTQSNLAILPQDALGNLYVRSNERLPGELLQSLRQLQGVNLSGNQVAWNASWTSSIAQLAGRGLYDVYRRGTTVTATHPYGSWFSVAYNTEGSGSWFVRKGPAMSGFSKDPNTLVAETVYSDSLNAVWRANLNDENPCGSTGFVVIGARQLASDASSERYPSFASFLSLYDDMTVVTNATRYTQIEVDTVYDGLNGAGFTGVISGGELEITLTGANSRFWRLVGPDNLTSVLVGYTMLELRANWSGVGYDKKPIHCVITALDSTNNKKCKVRRLDGSSFSSAPPGVPGGGVTGALRLQHLHWGLSDGVPEKRVAVEGSNPQPLGLRGMVYFTGPLATSAGTNFAKEAAKFIGDQDSTAVLSWGRATRTVTSAQSATYVPLGFLYANGNISAKAIGATTVTTSDTIKTPKLQREVGVADFGTPGTVALDLSTAMLAYHHMRVTISAASPVNFTALNLGTYGAADEGREIHLIFHHQTSYGQILSLSEWPSNVIFESPADALLSMQPNTIDHYIFHAVFTGASSKLFARVRRYSA